MFIFQLLGHLIVFFGVINLLRMAMFLVGADIYGLRQTWRHKKLARYRHYPRFTVVIPAHNEGETVLRAINSVVNNDYPRNRLEVVVVDDGSTDNTIQVIQKFINNYRYHNVRLVSQPNQGKARALNRVISSEEMGDLVMCLDADSALSPDAISKAVFHFTDPKVVALSANVKIVPRPGLLNLVQYYEYLLCYQMKRAESIFNFEYIVGGIGSTFRRSILKQVGFYDTDTVTEDIDLTMKILKLGNKKHKVEYGADVVVYTESVLDIAGLLRQRFRWKWGRSQTFIKNIPMFFSKDRKYTKSLSWFYLPFAIYGDLSYFIEPILFFYILGASLFYRDPLPLMSAGLVISLYLVLNVLAEDTVSWQKKLQLIILAPTMYALFYILSFVEYIALLKTVMDLGKLQESLEEDNCGWVHVQRPKLALLEAEEMAI